MCIAPVITHVCTSFAISQIQKKKIESAVAKYCRQIIRVPADHFQLNEWYLTCYLLLIGHINSIVCMYGMTRLYLLCAHILALDIVLRRNRSTGRRTWSLGGGGLASGSRMSFMIGKLSLMSVLFAARRPPLNSLRVSSVALLVLYTKLPSMYGVISLICDQRCRRC